MRKSEPPNATLAIFPSVRPRRSLNNRRSTNPSAREVSEGTTGPAMFGHKILILHELGKLVADHFATAVAGIALNGFSAIVAELFQLVRHGNFSQSDFRFHLA